ncbi:MAG: triose-phosphate isomerase [Candidatus Shapirobacteria bacterium]
MIWVNYKIYKETFGKKALDLAKICDRVSKETKIKIIPVVSAFDLTRVKKVYSGEVWVQHVDCYFEGRYTGWISPLQAIALEASGSLLNHSEHKLPAGKIRQTLAHIKKEKWVNQWAKEIRDSAVKEVANFKIMICFGSSGQAEGWLKKLHPSPDYVAYEPAELIGGKVSVSQGKPEMIKNIVELISPLKLIVGAGIHKKEDVQKALELGAKGILISSDVITAKDPYKELKELALAFKK